MIEYIKMEDAGHMIPEEYSRIVYEGQAYSRAHYEDETGAYSLSNKFVHITVHPQDVVEVELTEYGYGQLSLFRITKERDTLRAERDELAQLTSDMLYYLDTINADYLACADMLTEDEEIETFGDMAVNARLRKRASALGIMLESE